MEMTHFGKYLNLGEAKGSCPSPRQKLATPLVIFMLFYGEKVGSLSAQSFQKMLIEQ